MASPTVNSEARVEFAGLFYAATTAVTWGMVGIWVRLLPLPALFITGARLLIAFAGLLPFVLLSPARVRAFPQALRNRWSWFLAAALVAYYVLAVTAFQFGTVAEIGLFVGTSPAFILITRLARRQPISRREWIGAAIASVGIAFVLGPKIAAANAGLMHRLIGDLLALASAAMSAIYAGTFRALHEDEREDNPAPEPMDVALIAMVVGGTLLTAGSQIARPVAMEQLVRPSILLFLVVLGLLSTAVPSITYALASKRLPAIITTTSQLMIPVVATIAAAFILNEKPDWTLYVGGALIVYGIVHMFRPETKPLREGEATLVE